MKTSESNIERPIKPALLNGWKRTCPNCATGAMMNGYLQVHDACPVCSEEFHHHRADDGPSYVTILVSGHLLAPLMLYVFETYRPDPMTMFIGFTILFVVFALYLLPRIKGAFIALQWAKRMHGFSTSTANPP